VFASTKQIAVRFDGQARRGTARQGLAWRGEAGQGKARRGAASPFGAGKRPFSIQFQQNIKPLNLGRLAPWGDAPYIGGVATGIGLGQKRETGNVTGNVIGIDMVSTFRSGRQLCE
jgi:hypothetical protein